jgi:DDE superfamily endonuclease
MNLLDALDDLLLGWQPVFAHKRSWNRARRLTLGMLMCLRQHLTSQAICASGRQFVDWTSDYRLCSRCVWNPHSLFDPVFDHLPALLSSPTAPVIAALDDTLCPKTGRKIPGVTMARDPQSPAFHVNLRYGLRFVQVSVLISPPSPGPARALPVRFELAPPAVKPNKNASEEVNKAYQQEKKKRVLTFVGREAIHSVRRSLDERKDTRGRQLIMGGDGSYTNANVLKHLPERTTYIGRIRKDAKLHWPLPPTAAKSNGRPRRYGSAAPTPEEILKDESIPVVKVRCFAAGEERELPVKVVGPVYWRKAGVGMPLQLVVIKPLGYRLRNGSKLLYRQPAFLICTDPNLDLPMLAQSYVYRWEIECNHRDEKSLLGVAQGQVRNPQAVRRLPQLQVAGYSMVLLASLLSSGFQRTAEYLPLAKWRRKAIRPSLLDMLALLRDQIFARTVSNPSRLTFGHFVDSSPADTKSTKPPFAAQTICTLAA